MIKKQKWVRFALLGLLFILSGKSISVMASERSEEPKGYLNSIKKGRK